MRGRPRPRLTGTGGGSARLAGLATATINPAGSGGAGGGPAEGPISPNAEAAERDEPAVTGAAPNPEGGTSPLAEFSATGPS